MATGQMPHPDIFLIIMLAVIQTGLYSDWPLFISTCARQCKCCSVMKALFSAKQIFGLKNSRIYGKNKNNS
jgi:hypothetical protein